MSIPRSSHTNHRQAFGPRQARSPETKARYIAESILLHEAEGHVWTIHQYGLDVESQQWTLVLNSLATLRAAQARTLVAA